MPQFSQKSLDQLKTVDYRLQLVCHKAISFFDFSVLEGRRSHDRQQRLYEQDKTKVQFPHSNHNPNPASNVPQSEQLVKAVDIAPYPVNFGEDLEGEKRRKIIARFYYLAGCMWAVGHDLGVPLRWGGDWDSDHVFTDQKFDDLVHFELD